MHCYFLPICDCRPRKANHVFGSSNVQICTWSRAEQRMIPSGRCRSTAALLLVEPGIEPASAFPRRTGWVFPCSIRSVSTSRPSAPPSRQGDLPFLPKGKAWPKLAIKIPFFVEIEVFLRAFVCRHAGALTIAALRFRRKRSRNTCTASSSRPK